MIVAIATPATLALSYYHLTGDPTFQPLALTVERLAAVGHITQASPIIAVIHTGTSEADIEHGKLFGQRLYASFYGKGLPLQVTLEPTRTTAPLLITFHIGRNTLGPYTEATAAQGVRAAAEAVNFVRTQSLLERAHRW